MSVRLEACPACGAVTQQQVWTPDIWVMEQSSSWMSPNWAPSSADRTEPEPKLWPYVTDPHVVLHMYIRNVACTLSEYTQCDGAAVEGSTFTLCGTSVQCSGTRTVFCYVTLPAWDSWTLVFLASVSSCYTFRLLIPSITNSKIMKTLLMRCLLITADWWNWFYVKILDQ